MSNYALALVAVTLVFLFQAPFLNEPLSLDEGVYFTVAQSSSLPYVEAFDQKPPLIYAWYKLALAVNAGIASPFAIHLLATGVLAAVAVILFGFGRFLVSPAFGALAAMLFGLLVANRWVVNSANTETFALPALVLSLALFARGMRGGGASWFILSGVLGAMASLTKWTLLIPEMALLIVLFGSGHRAAVLWQAMLFMLALFLGIVIGVVPWLVTGHFADFWFANVTFNARYAAEVPLSARPALVLLGLGGAAVGSLIIVVLALAGLRASTIPSGDRRLIWVWGAATLLSFTATGLTFVYYFVAIFPAVALLAASSLIDLSAQWQRQPLRTRLIACGLALALLYPTANVLAPQYLARDPEETHVQKFHAGGELDVLAVELAEVVSLQTDPEDAIYVVGSAAQIYALADRRPAAKVFLSPFIGLAPELFAGAVDEVSRARPRLIAEVVTPGSHVDKDPVTGSFRKLLEADYEVTYAAQYRGAVGRIWHTNPRSHVTHDSGR